MTILFLLVGSVLFLLMFFFWTNSCQINTGERSSVSTIALIGPSSSTGLIKSNADESLTTNTFSQDISINVPRIIVMQKKILVDLEMVEYRLAELEQLLVTKCSAGKLVKRKCSGMLTE